MRPHTPFAVLVLSVLCAFSSTAQAAGGKQRASGKAPVPVSIFVPCGMAAPFQQALQTFRAANPGIAPTGRYDNDVELLEMVRDRGKRPDLFVSPGGRELAVLIEKGLADEKATVRLGSYTLVAVVRKGLAAKVRKPADLASGAVRSIALSNPETSSVGWHVRQSLRKLGLWDRVEGKVRPARRLIEAYETLLQGGADVVFTYRGCPLPADPAELARTNVRIAFTLPTDSYDVPRVAVGVLSSSRHPREARQLLSFLGSEVVSGMMVAKGLPDERSRAGKASASAQARPAAARPAGGKVEITAFFPDDERHQDVRAFIRSLDRKFPGRLRVRLHNFKDPEADPEGFRKWQETRFGCAGLLVNGKNAVALGAGAQARTVRFQRKMGVQWTQADLLAAIRQELRGGRR